MASTPSVVFVKPDSSLPPTVSVLTLHYHRLVRKTHPHLAHALYSPLRRLQTCSYLASRSA
ncbi:hypothetical protein E2C01_037926 [Portunus trituberculatus]|uniref:Uncharacterized protein n=1 Tax=Portunus trituberculatus TaxID=210409 RepID=A0A5B7FFF2_PORTR|nr:hypothetical protein [Portunus trituberculatus]